MKNNIAIAVTMMCLIDAHTYARSEQSNFCSTLTSVAREAGNKFRKFRAGLDESRLDYRSSVTLPGAKECSIGRPDGDLTCAWGINFDQNAQKELRAFAYSIRDCYPSGEFRENYPKEGWYSHLINGVKFRLSMYHGQYGDRILMSIEQE